MRKFLANYGTMLIFAIVCLIMPFGSEYFLKRINLENILKQSSIIGIMACGMVPVLLSGNIDISIGALMGMSGALCAKLSGLDAPLSLVFIIPVLVTMLISLCSGILITKLRLNPFIVTLGIMYIARGFIYVVTQEESLGNIADLVLILGSGSIYNIPILPIIFFMLAFLMYIFMHKTRTGNYIRAVGGNEQTALEWGLNPGTLTNLAFMISGLFTGIAGILNLGRMMCAEAQSGVGFEFQVLAAFVIGGGVLFAGEGSVGKTLLGVFLVSIINNGMDLLNILPFIQLITKGMIVIIAVGMVAFFRRQN